MHYIWFNRINLKSLKFVEKCRPDKHFLQSVRILSGKVFIWLKYSRSVEIWIQLNSSWSINLIADLKECSIIKSKISSHFLQVLLYLCKQAQRVKVIIKVDRKPWGYIIASALLLNANSFRHGVFDQNVKMGLRIFSFQTKIMRFNVILLLRSNVKPTF